MALEPWGATSMGVGVGLNGKDQGARPKRQARDPDRCIGARIRERRIVLGLSQQAFAKQIGVTHQQVGKYEQGTSGIAAGRLYQIARTLGVRGDRFFEDLANGSKVEPSQEQPLLLELTRAFTGIIDPRQRAALCGLARALATEPAKKDDERAAE